MPLAHPSRDDDDDTSLGSTSTPQRKGNNDSSPHHHAPTTPTTRKGPGPGAAPMSAPAATGGRPRANSKKPEPTLLTDFLLGRPSQARVVADRKHRKGVEAVKAELRQEMRQSSVKRLQPPGGVRDRVSAWQRTHATTMAKGDPEYAATEPTDVAFKDDEEESVTEEDRVRIKMRQNKRSLSRPKPVPDGPGAAASTHPSDDAVDISRPKSPPKKRVVSDDNWRKPKGRRNSPRRASPKADKPVTPQPIPSDFVLRSAPNPNVSYKIKEWAAKVEVPEATPPRSSRSSKTRAKSSRSEGAVSEAGDSSSQVTARHAPKSRTGDDDGIRVTPSRRKLDDDGIRVTPMGESSRQRPRTDPSRVSRPRSKATSASARGKSPSDRIEVTEEPSELSQTTRSHQGGTSDQIEVIEYPESVLDTPTKRPGVRRRPPAKARPTTSHLGTSKLLDNPSSRDEDSNLSSAYHPSSDVASSIANKSVADLPGDIPFGQSAFSELDLSLKQSRPKRPKVERNSSLKSMPNVFKKVVEEGKKIIHDIQEPPRQHAVNNPPSIEKWLNNTVDPFVDDSSKASATPKQQSAEKEMAGEPKMRRQSTHEARTSRNSTPKTEDIGDQENTAPHIEENETVKPHAVKEASSPSSAGLKRSRATRGPSSPLKSAGRRPFLGALMEAFKGESSGHTTQPKSYQSQEQRKYDEYEGMSESYHSSDYTSTAGPSDAHTEADSFQEDPRTPKMAGPRYRPPTNGHHELSTILSEDDSSAVDSDLTSVTQSTLTQSTVLTKDSEPEKQQNHAPGLKRRLTRHSDLVSVLSLPDNSKIPSGIRNNRSRPSLRKARGTSDDVTAEELLREFVDDENLYLRELKTLVDGVVPVLLSHAVNGTSAADLFAYGAAGSSTSGLSKSVVNMGVALEKLNNAHRKAPTSDIRRLANWAHGVVPYYKRYLSAWRLGFEDVVVNLAPAAGGLDDEDSLLNAMPRNERGDIINADGQRVAVSHLLKRPLIRVKQMTKLIECLDAIIDSNDTHDLLRDFENLQETARRRHKEESARMMDEDAINTDTTRARDPRTFDVAKSVSIDSSRQVNAKDVFSLDLAHSNGQRLECQVELVQRDNQNYPDDQGDLLIRETGEGRKSHLLFSPISMSMVSARTGEGHLDMVIMVRGMHNGKAWHELLTLVADDEDQVLDWLDILPLSPVPPEAPEPSVFGMPSHDRTPFRAAQGTPVGAQIPLPESPRSPIAKDLSTASPEAKRALPSRYRPQRASMPTTLSAAAAPERQDSETSPAQQDRTRESRSRPLSESMRPDPRNLREEKPNDTPYREDGAPPPPVHRTLSPSPQPADNSAPSLPPPAESQTSERLKRRGSSPLKHEYLPSDTSSGEETYSTEVSDAESSDDDIESVDIPETELGVSIKREAPPATESRVSESECSLTPSNSASQAGMHGHKTAAEDNAERYMATISRWSEKGTWKDISGQPCSIIVTAGLVEAFAFRNGDSKNNDKPLIALDLTPLVLIRQSTAVDLEIRSSVQPHSLLHQAHNGGNFRFRCSNAPDCFSLYMSVHHARLNNQKFIQLENEARFKSFGERKAAPENDEPSSSSRRRSWFGRKNSYRSSVRAPSQSHDGASTTPSSNPSASSFLKRLTVAGNLSFNIARSSVDRQSMGSGGNSLYTSGSSSAGGTPPRSPSVSVENSGRGPANLGTENIRIRLHLLVAGAKWEDYGNCSLQIRQPPPGWRQALRADHGLEKRVTATTLPKKDSEAPRIVLDAVLGSGCFSPMGARGIVCGVWEEVRNGDGVVGMVPATGATGGNIKKWCFQCANAAEAAWVLRLVHQEVFRA